MMGKPEKNIKKIAVRMSGEAAEILAGVLGGEAAGVPVEHLQDTCPEEKLAFVASYAKLERVKKLCAAAEEFPHDYTFHTKIDDLMKSAFHLYWSLFGVGVAGESVKLAYVYAHQLLGKHLHTSDALPLVALASVAAAGVAGTNAGINRLMVDVERFSVFRGMEALRPEKLDALREGLRRLPSSSRSSKQVQVLINPSRPTAPRASGPHP